MDLFTTRTPIDDPILKQLLLEHVMPYLQEKYTVLVAAVDSLTTAQSPNNRYVIKVVFLTLDGMNRHARLVIGRNGELRNNMNWK